jgi:hypothetical protein
VERLARDFMGDTDSLGWGWVTPSGLSIEWTVDIAGRSFRIGWNPFTDAAADYDVLQRARNTWAKEYRGNTAEPWSVFSEAVGRGCRYEVGDYARAVLAVLDSQEGKP